MIKLNGELQLKSSYLNLAAHTSVQNAEVAKLVIRNSTRPDCQRNFEVEGARASATFGKAEVPDS